MKLKKEDLEGKTPDEVLSLIVEAHEESQNTIKSFENLKSFSDQSADIQQKQADIHEALTVLESVVVDRQKETDAEIVKLKQGGGWKAEQAEEAKEKQKSAYELFIRTRVEDMSIKQREQLEEAISTKAMIAGSSSEGGFLIIPDQASEIDRLVIESSTLRGLATVINGSSSSWEQPIQEGRAGARYVGETQSRTETDTPTFNNFKVEANEINAEPQVTRKSLDDSAFNVLSFLTAEVAAEIGILEGNRHFTGTGVNEPEGILTLPNGLGFGKIEQTAGTKDGDIAYKDLVNLNTSLKTLYRNNSNYGATRETIGVLRNIVDLEGRPLLQADIQTGGLLNLFQRPLLEMSDMEQVPTTTGDGLAMVFGDFRRAYVIYDRQGIEVLRDPFSNKPFIIFSHTFRSGAGVRKGDALKLLSVNKT